VLRRINSNRLDRKDSLAVSYCCKYVNHARALVPL
jgi:hypothetical protein